MAADLPQPSVLEPACWAGLTTTYAIKGDMFSARTLMVIHEGVEQLAASVRDNSGIVVTSSHAMVFERLQRAFNNPNLLREVGSLYLEEFRMPAIALKHFDLARQLAPKDREIGQLQVVAALAIARQMTGQPGLSGLDHGKPDVPQVDAMLRKTTKLAHIGDTRAHLDETAGELGRKQEAWRKTGTLKSAAAGDPAIFSGPLERARQAVESFDFDAAPQALAAAAKAGAPREELQAFYAQLGLAAYDHGRLEDALAAFEQMRDLGPEAVEGWFNCGLVFQKMGRLPDALASYQKAAKVAPDNAKTWCNLSAVWFERGEHAESEKAARRSIELKPDYARAWDNLASALGAMKRLPEAAEACQQAIHIQPALHSAWFKFGVVNFQLDELIKADEAFKMSSDSPDFATYVQYYFSMIAARRGDLETAVEKLEAASAADPGNELETTATRELAAAFTRAGEYEIAADFHHRITAKRPDDFSAWLALGTARHRANQYDEARSAYFRAIDLNSASAVPWHNLGMLSSDRGLKKEARDYFQREVELAPDDAKAWYDYGVSLHALGLDDEGARAYEQAEGLVKSLARRSSDLSAAMSIVRRLNLGERVLKEE